MNEQILAVQKMQDYININLKNHISMTTLSNVSNFSPWYSYRLFRKYTGLTPTEYIRRLRLSKSALKLKNGGCRIIDVAFDLGFSSIDGYTRAFYREFSCNPSEYIKEPKPITIFIPYGVKFKKLRKDNVDMKNLQSVFVSVICKPKRKVIIKRGVKAEDYFPYCEEVGCDIWGILMSMDSLCGEPVCLWLPKKYKKPNTSTYVQGVEVSADFNGEIPDGFDIITLPATEYLSFQGEPFEEENYCEAIQAVKYAIHRYNPTIIGYIWDDKNPRIQLEPRGKRGYVEMRAVKLNTNK